MAGWKEAKELLELLPKEKTELLNQWAMGKRKHAQSTKDKAPRIQRYRSPWAMGKVPSFPWAMGKVPSFPWAMGKVPSFPWAKGKKGPSSQVFHGQWANGNKIPRNMPKGHGQRKRGNGTPHGTRDLEEPRI